MESEFLNEQNNGDEMPPEETEEEIEEELDPEDLGMEDKETE